MFVASTTNVPKNLTPFQIKLCKTHPRPMIFLNLRATLDLGFRDSMASFSRGLFCRGLKAPRKALRTMPLMFSWSLEGRPCNVRLKTKLRTGRRQESTSQFGTLQRKPSNLDGLKFKIVVSLGSFCPRIHVQQTADYISIH